MDTDVLAGVQSRASEILVPLGEQYDALASNRISHILILIGHCIVCVQSAPDVKGNWLLHYIMTFVLGFGGAMWSSLLLMRPFDAPISWIKNNDIGLYFTLTWWIVVYSPLSRPANWLLRLWPVKVIPTACVLFFKSRTVVARVELVASLFPGVWMSPIALATIAGCGGMCTYDAIRAAYGLNDRPAEVTMAGKSFRVAFLVACMHFGNLLLPRPLLPSTEMKTLLTTLCVGHALASGLTGLGLDWTEALLRPLLALARIPWPTGAPLPFPTAAKKLQDQQERRKRAAAAAAPAASPEAQAVVAGKAASLAPAPPPVATKEQPPKRKGPAQQAKPPTPSPPPQQQQQQQGGKKGRKRWGDEQAVGAPAATNNGVSTKATHQAAGSVYVAGPGLAAPNPFAALQDVDDSGNRKRQ